MKRAAKSKDVCELRVALPSGQGAMCSGQGIRTYRTKDGSITFKACMVCVALAHMAGIKRSSFVEVTAP
jgi:hypothetical protein